MIRSKRGLWVVLILTLGVGLIVMLPARVVYSLAEVPELQISGISGSIWSGTANEAAINGVFLRNIEWHSKPWHLLAGTMTMRVKAEPPSGFVEFIAAAGIGGRITLRELTASLSLAAFSDPLRIDGLRGTGSFRFDRIVIEDGAPTAADGTVELAELVVPMLQSGSLGAYRAEFSTQNNGIRASVEDNPGVVDLAGSLKLDPDRRFEFVGLIVATAATPKSLQDRMKFLPPPNERGQREIRLEGSY